MFAETNLGICGRWVNFGIVYRDDMVINILHRFRYKCVWYHYDKARKNKPDQSICRFFL